MKSPRCVISGAESRLEKVPMGVSHGWGISGPLPCIGAPPRCHGSVFPDGLLDEWPNPHRGWAKPRVSPPLDLHHFSGCPRISSALIVHMQNRCVGGIWSPPRMELKEARLCAVLCLLQGLSTTCQHPGFQAGTFNAEPATPWVHITDCEGLSQQALE